MFVGCVFDYRPRVETVLRTVWKVALVRKSLETSFYARMNDPHFQIVKGSTVDPTFILANILQTTACGGISTPPPPPQPPLVYSRPRAPLFSVFTRRSFGGASIILHSFFFFFVVVDILRTRDFITGVLMSRRESRLTKWSYQTNSVGTNSWFWQQRFCHLH